MIYHPIPRSDYLSSIKITAEFLPENTCPSIGTGFLVKRDEEFFLVTAKHNISESHLSPQEKTGKTLNEFVLQVFIRTKTGYNPFGARFLPKDYEFIECPNENDLAVTRLTLENPNNVVISFDFNDLATDEELDLWDAGEPVFLSGYPPLPTPIPGHENSPIPILRRGVFSNLPVRGFRIPGKLGSDYSYIDTFALGGFSGCPVLTPEIGIAKNEQNTISTGRYIPKKVVGMLVGRANVSERDFKNYHSGLSYFVRSPSIINLIKSYRV